MAYFIVFLFILIGIFNIFLFLLGKKIVKLEKKITQMLIKRSSLIPSFYDISKPYIMKHSEVFKEILLLRNIEFNECGNNTYFFKIIETEYKIHNELNFIIKVCLKNQKLLKNGKFILLRDLLIDVSNDIGENVSLHKKIARVYNKLTALDKFLLIGLIIPLEKIIEI